MHWWKSRNTLIAALALAAIALSLVLRVTQSPADMVRLPLLIALLAGGAPLLWLLLKKLFRGEFGSDLLAGMSIATAAVMGEYLVATIVVLMFAGGQALEDYAVRRANFVLEALARRMPQIAHRPADHGFVDVPLDDVAVGDRLVVLPHEACPVDGTVVEGRSTMDESFLTGEPYLIRKTPGASVISGALNGEAALTIVAEKRAVDSRYARIMAIVERAELNQPPIRRVADRLGAWYTPLALVLAGLGWGLSGESSRFLGVLVIATPCPLLLGIPVALIGSISLAAERGIIIKRPEVLEQISKCRTFIFDKTGTLTYGKPELIEILPGEGVEETEILGQVAALEQYSKHPLAQSVLKAAAGRNLDLPPVEHVSEKPGAGLTGAVKGSEITITARRKLNDAAQALLPPETGGMEAVVLRDGEFAAVFRFRDEPRSDTRRFLDHLSPRHRVAKLMLVSGDRESEVRHLAEAAGIEDVHWSQSPEQKVEIVRAETAKAPTVYLGDGINDAPAMLHATVGIAFGQNSDITSEAAHAVILEASLKRVDELLHIGRRMFSIAMQSAVGGMALSALGMLAAAWGFLPPLEGAIAQEVIDVLAVLNSLRAALPGKVLSDFG